MYQLIENSLFDTDFRVRLEAEKTLKFLEAETVGKESLDSRIAAASVHSAGGFKAKHDEMEL